MELYVEVKFRVKMSENNEVSRGELVVNYFVFIDYVLFLRHSKSDFQTIFYFSLL